MHPCWLLEEVAYSSSSNYGTPESCIIICQQASSYIRMFFPAAVACLHIEP